MRGDFKLSSANVTLNEPLNVPFNAYLNEIPTWRGLMFDIFDCWNRIGSRLREEVNFAEFKKKLKIVQNKFLPCDKINCYICKN